MAVASALGSCYLGYVLKFILEDTCLVCVSTYCVNAALLVTTFLGRNGSNEKKPKSN
jgi:vitamin-K-epoxide reductase (warfarin-sensitive)